MKKKKKSRFLNFCFSFLPGAAEMYMGFMKAGVSLMGLFFGLCACAGLLDMPIMILLITVVWFYGFFHANNLAGLNDEEFAQVQDEYLLGAEIFDAGKEDTEKYRKWLAYLLIGFGVILLWNIGIELLMGCLPNGMRWIVWEIKSVVPQIAVSVLVIFAGIKMIQGKKKTLFLEETEEKKENSKEV